MDRSRASQMNLLLDTDAIVRIALYPGQVGEVARKAIESGANSRFISVVTIWEMATKVAIGKLTLPATPSALVPEMLAALDARLLLVELRHLREYEWLPLLHRDPFDRMLIAQAMADGLTVITSDRTIPAYDVPTLW